MSIYDYHYRILNPEVWKSDELSLTASTNRFLADQISRRFAANSGVFLVGDLVGHYYTPESNLDVIVRAPEAYVKDYLREAEIVNGFNLGNTAHLVNFHIVSDSTVPNALAEKFGPMFEVNSNTWVGRRVTDITEMTNVDSLMQAVNWKLYKKRNSLELRPYQWKVLSEAFQHLNEDERQKTISNLKYTARKLERNIRNVIKAYNQEEVWKNSSVFAEVLEEDGHQDAVDDFVLRGELPAPVMAAIINRFRYEDVVGRLEQLDERLSKDEASRMNAQLPSYNPTPEGTQAVGIDASVRQASTPAQKYLWQRLDSVVDMILSKYGGYGKALDTVYKIFSYVLEKNRYVGTDSRRKIIVQRLYRKYYQHLD